MGPPWLPPNFKMRTVSISWKCWISRWEQIATYHLMHLCFISVSWGLQVAAPDAQILSQKYGHWILLHFIELYKSIPSVDFSLSGGEWRLGTRTSKQVHLLRCEHSLRMHADTVPYVTVCPSGAHPHFIIVLLAYM